MPEKRSYIRILISGKAVIKMGDETLKGEMHNISFGGFSGYFERELEPGTALTFELTPYSIMTTLKGKGVVKASEPALHYGARCFRVGVAFVDVDKYLVISFINNHESAMKEQKKAPKNFDPTWGPL